MSTSPIYYFRDTKTGADVNATAGDDTNSGLTDANAFQTYGKLVSLHGSAPAGTQFLMARGGGFTTAAGWTIRNDNGVTTLSGITRSGTTATATATNTHNLEVGDTTTITGCDQSDYNISATLTAATTTTFEFTVAGSPTTPATTSDKMRFTGSGIYLDHYTSTEYTQAVDAKPYVSVALDSDFLKISGSAVNQEGYYFKNTSYKYDGTLGASADFLFLYQEEKDTVVFDGVTIDGWRVGIGVNSTAGVSSNVQVLNCDIKNNYQQGILASSTGLLIDNNTITNNGHNNATGGSALLHNIYITGGSDVIIRNNTLYQSALNSGTPRGTSLVGHTSITNMDIYDNYIYEDVAGDATGNGAWGISINTGHAAVETFTNINIYRNKIENVGNVAINASAWDGGVIENNIIIQNQTAFTSKGISCTDETVGTGNGPNTDINIRNNSIYGNIRIGIEASEGTGFNIVSNSVHSTTTGVFSLLDVPLSITDTTNYDVIDNNVAYAPSASSVDYELTTTGALSAWQTASVFSDNDQVSDPLYTDAANEDLTIGSGSPCVDNGHATLSAAGDYLEVTRGASPDIGAYEYISVLVTSWISKLYGITNSLYGSNLYV